MLRKMIAAVLLCVSFAIPVGAGSTYTYAYTNGNVYALNPGDTPESLRAFPATIVASTEFSYDLVVAAHDNLGQEPGLYVCTDNVCESGCGSVGFVDPRGFQTVSIWVYSIWIGDTRICPASDGYVEVAAAG